MCKNLPQRLMLYGKGKANHDLTVQIRHDLMQDPTAAGAALLWEERL